MRINIYIGLLLVSQFGCQCCGVTEWYQDRIDYIADHECNLDHCYRPWLDLTQIKRCGDNGCPRVAGRCRPRLCETQPQRTTQALVQHDTAATAKSEVTSKINAVDLPPAPQVTQSQTAAEPEPEANPFNEVQWIHFEPLPAMEPPVSQRPELEAQESLILESADRLERPTDADPQPLFEAPPPAFQPKLSAPLSVRPNPFLQSQSR